MHSDLGICRPRVQRRVYQLFLLACVRTAAEAAGDSLCRRDRRAACILVNAPTHMLADCEVVQGHGLKLINLSNLQIIFLPANVTNHAEPLDQGIIACVKAHYRRRLIKWMLDAANAPGNEQKSLKELALTFYQMIRWVHEAWMQDVSQVAIAICWQHAGILPDAWLQPAPAQDGAVLHVRNASSTEDDSMPIASNGAEQADQMDARLGGAQAQLQAALDELDTVAHNRALLGQAPCPKRRCAAQCG
jgi:hypothetical protein